MKRDVCEFNAGAPKRSSITTEYWCFKMVHNSLLGGGGCRRLVIHAAELIVHAETAL
jgi:hypothetical protein